MKTRKMKIILLRAKSQMIRHFSLGAKIKYDIIRKLLLLESVSRSVMSNSLWPHGLLAHQVPLSMEFSRQEYWSGCHFLLQGIFPTQELNPHLFCLLHWQASSQALPGKPYFCLGIWFSVGHLLILRGGHGSPLQYSRLENPMARGTWGLQSIGLQSWIWLKLLSTAPFAYTRFSVSKMLLVKNRG